MKILHVLYSGLGGHGNVFFSMVEADEKKEYDFKALFNGIEPIKQDYINKCNELNIDYRFVGKKSGFDFEYYRNLYKEIKATSPDVLFLHGGAAVLQGWLYKKFSGKKTTIVVRETQANHLKTKIDWLYLILSMVFADKMVFLTDMYAKQIAQKFPRLYARANVSVVPNGIDLGLFKPKPQASINANKIVIGMASRITAIKDHDTLLDAFFELAKSFGNIELRIAGDGTTKTQLEDKVRKAGMQNQVVFAGLLNEEQLVSFLQGLDIYVHASLGETMSTSIMQAMACQLPIIASDVDGINNMIENGVTGLLVPCQNASALVEVFSSLINNERKRQALANQAYLFAKNNFSNKKMLERYKTLW